MPIDQNIKVTADAVVFSLGENADQHILLIQRKNEPFKENWAFPGGFVEDDEDLNTAAARELQEETGLDLKAEEFVQLGAWGKPGRDPRGRTVTVAFMVKVDMASQQVKAADDAKAVKWWPVNDLPKLAFDHQEILKAALDSIAP
ncbi:NUDIX hydrolase [Fulvivirga kasyanovii]|uniref:NUDIX hydrolase n=1 Tax=Fulvivirga kasyanovii TaxID=396812 RepID=A0ABW9RMF3_9BACT|nr:NUDIX hydrolase [Fulvivirga kasyanovii]MTI25116.1 NUDIX hydrolase [Fulvivirga kasyanovii]